VSYETEEQQLEQLKDWWNENGTPLIVGAILGLAGFGGWKYWNQQQIAYQEAASDLYLKVTEVAESDNKADLAESAMAVKTQYPESSYAILSAFHLAKAAVEAQDYDKAIAELTWVIDNHADNELVSIAKIRLARIFVQQDKATDALPLVELDSESGYYALANLVKGDALLALDRQNDALEAYKLASADLEVVARHPTLQLKIESLSGTNSSHAVTSDSDASQSETDESVNSESDTAEETQ